MVFYEYNKNALIQINWAILHCRLLANGLISRIFHHSKQTGHLSSKYM
jgi:hypothetical protein